MSDASHGAFLDGFIELIESRRLAVCGMGGQLPLIETGGVVSARGRGSPTDADRKALLDWLQQHLGEASAQAGDFVDGWYESPRVPRHFRASNLRPNRMCHE